MLALLWGRVAPYVLGAVAIGAAILGYGASQRRAGRDQVRAETIEKTLESRNAQDQAAAAAPRGPDAVADSLRRGEF